jgi:hypothetical protein
VQKANRIIGEEMSRLGWKETELACRLKNDPGKLAIAARVRTETPLPIKWIAERLQMGTSKSLKPMLLHWTQVHGKPANQNPPTNAPCQQLQFQPPVDPFTHNATCSRFGNHHHDDSCGRGLIPPNTPPQIECFPVPASQIQGLRGFLLMLLGVNEGPCKVMEAVNSADFCTNTSKNGPILTIERNVSCNRALVEVIENMPGYESYRLRAIAAHQDHAAIHQ